MPPPPTDTAMAAPIAAHRTRHPADASLSSPPAGASGTWNRLNQDRSLWRMPSLDRLTTDGLRATVVAFRDALAAHQDTLNRLNVYPVPDGDTGTNMRKTMDNVVDGVERAATDHAAVCAAIARESLMGARGNSGVILCQFLRGLTKALESHESATAGDVAAALAAAADGAYTAVLTPIEGTILTVMRAIGDGAQAAAGRGDDLVAVVRAAREAGGAALARTPELLPVLKEAGVVDAGGAGIVLFPDAMLHVLAGEPLPKAPEGSGPAIDHFDSVSLRHAADGGVDVSELRYEVMYFLDLDDARIGEFRAAWGAIGGSIVVVGGDGLWNCHIHTNDIGAAIEVPLELGGRPSKIRVTDLFEEVAEEHAHREAELHGTSHMSTSTGLPPVRCAVVAVASGDGLVELFGQLGVQGVVTGGQTLNPSTAELLDAVEAVNSHEVIVLPNNKNIIPVAEQLTSLTSKTVVVVPTRTMPEALAALVVYDPEADAAANAAEMGDAVTAVATGEVTQAIRDTQSDAGPISVGDWIGIVRGEGIVAISGSVVGAATALLDQLVDDGREIVTVVAGADATPGYTDAITEWLAQQRPDVEVEVHRGGQPLYPYLFGVE